MPCHCRKPSPVLQYIEDIAFRICPITLNAEEIITERKGSAILKGTRDTKQLSQQRHSAEFKQVIINRLIVSACGGGAIDARIILA